MNAILLIGRIILGGFFIYSGGNHFIGFGMMTHYATMKGVPFPAFAHGTAGLMLVLGGLSLVSGIYPVAGIVLLVGFLVPVSLMMHNFWKLEDPPGTNGRQGQFSEEHGIARSTSHASRFAITMAPESGAVKICRSTTQIIRRIK